MYNFWNQNLKPQHVLRSHKGSTHSEPFCISDMNVATGNELAASCSCGNYNFGNTNRDYYKNYEHDETPVKEFSIRNTHSTRDGIVALTNSDLDKLKMNIHNNSSEELQIDFDSVGSLESHIKFFKITVQEIFDNFYTSMKDFELYKKRFHDIMEKNREDSLEDMEVFIKDIIAHIMSSDSNVTNKSTEIFQITYDSSENNRIASNTSDKGNIMVGSDIGNKNHRNLKREDNLNIFLVSSDPCVDIKMNSSNHLSKINIKKSMKDYPEKEVASADNLKILAAKKEELDNYVMQKRDSKSSYVEIPVKVSNAKKNIHMDEDFALSSGDSKSFITRICSYLCKKLRKTVSG